LAADGSPPLRWTAALDHLAADKSVEEVILSGGDPWTLTDDVLSRLVDHLAAIPHLQRVRVHTRVPVMIPERITSDLLAWLRGTRLTPVVVLHANHPAELDDVVGEAIARLVDGGVPLLNQSVLLRGVNDDLSTLVALSRRLVRLRVMPYYLHQLDRVAGAAHFEVPVTRGRQLMSQLRRRLPGYAVPRYVRETVGAPCKTPLC
jgi:KamA family protein